MRAIDFVFDQTVSSMMVSLLELCSESGQDLRRKNESKEWEGGWGIRKEGGKIERGKKKRQMGKGYFYKTFILSVEF